MTRPSRIYIAGGATLAGAALRQRVRMDGEHHLIGEPPDEPDLTHAGQVEDFFAEMRPEVVVLAAGLSGGIGLNRARPADLLLDNLLVNCNVLSAAQTHGVRKLLYLGSSCSYPRDAAQPLSVESLFTGPVEPTSAPYAMGKLAGLQLCQAFNQQHGTRFIPVIPANAFGPHDDFGSDSGHVLPALIRRTHEAHERGDSELRIWGSGSPLREFLHADDLADACLFILARYSETRPLNVGSGTCLSIAEAARAVADVVGYRGRLVFDTSKPDGAPRKQLDSAPLFRMGWRPRMDFRAALAQTYDWFLQHEVAVRP